MSVAELSGPTKWVGWVYRGPDAFCVYVDPVELLDHGSRLVRDRHGRVDTLHSFMRVYDTESQARQAVADELKANAQRLLDEAGRQIGMARAAAAQGAAQ